MRVVLDTNILVSAARSRRGAAFRLVSLIPDSRFTICVSTSLYMEYLDVLSRPHVRPSWLSWEQIESTIMYLTSNAHLQQVSFRWRPFLPDANDDMVLELAAAAGAQYIVTFNRKHFKGIEKFGIAVASPYELLVEIGEIK